jgi:hypothetical protein
LIATLLAAIDLDGIASIVAWVLSVLIMTVVLKSMWAHVGPRVTGSEAGISRQNEEFAWNQISAATEWDGFYLLTVGDRTLMVDTLIQPESRELSTLFDKHLSTRVREDRLLLDYVFLAIATVCLVVLIPMGWQVIRLFLLIAFDFGALLTVLWIRRWRNMGALWALGLLCAWVLFVLAQAGPSSMMVEVLTRSLGPEAVFSSMKISLLIVAFEALLFVGDYFTRRWRQREITSRQSS